MENQIKSKCCDSIITVRDFYSLCNKCGNSVNPINGDPFINSDKKEPYKSVY